MQAKKSHARIISCISDNNIIISVRHNWGLCQINL